MQLHYSINENKESTKWASEHRLSKFEWSVIVSLMQNYSWLVGAPFYLKNIGVKVRPSYNPTCAIISSFPFHGHFQYSISWHRWKSAAIVTSVSKKSEQTTVVIQYYKLSRFFWNRHYNKLRNVKKSKNM